MDESKQVFIGTDCGATMSKVGGVWADGTTISTKLQQQPTNFQLGREAVVAGWIEAVGKYLAQNGISWEQVSSVGLAIPGPYLRYGVLGHSANMPASFDGLGLLQRLQPRAGQEGRPRDAAGRRQRRRVRRRRRGAARARRRHGRRADARAGLGPRDGVHRRARPAAAGRHAGGNGDRAHAGGAAPAGREAVSRAGAAAPGAASSCTRRWRACPTCWPKGCPPIPTIRSRTSTQTPKEKALALRGLAQKGDPLAVELFDFQARAMGLHIANLVLVLDPEFVVIGGGLMDPENTTDAFRARYLDLVRETARPHLWPVQRDRLTVVPSTLGELSQAIGAALVALYRSRR